MFRGNSPSTSVVNGSDITIVFENVTANLSNMSFGDGVNVEFINSDVTLDNVSIHDVTFEGALFILRTQHHLSALVVLWKSLIAKYPLFLQL